MRWGEAQALLHIEAAPRPFPKELSDYDLARFRQGATITPKILTLVASINASSGDPNKLTVTTQKSAKSPWNRIEPLTGVFPRSWIRKTLKSQRLQPFCIYPSMDKTIIPINSRGTDLTVYPGSICDSWRELDKTYKDHMGLGRSTPKSLIGRLNFNNGLSYQLRIEAEGKVQVVYPTSADVMRAARMAPGDAIIDSSVYWFIADSPREAAYLVGVLNAPALTEAFAESRTSGRTYHKNPWRAVPIPVFDPSEDTHRRIADLALRAEELTHEFLTNAKNGGGGPARLPFQGGSGIC